MENVAAPIDSGGPVGKANTVETHPYTTEQSPDADSSPRLRFWRAATALFIPGFIGTLSLIPFIARSLRKLPSGIIPVDTPFALLVALSLIQPAFLLAAAVGVGIWLAPKLGLTSRVAYAASGSRSALHDIRRDLRPALLSGIVLGLAVIILDAFLLPLAGEAAQSLSVSGDRPFWYLIMGTLYGGITEEIMMRWGLMTFLAWLCWLFVQRGSARPRPPVMWVSITLAALIFGFGHLGTVAAAAPLTTMLVLRTLLLNGLAGMVFGWLYWRFSLEAAMISHATFHVLTPLVAWSGLLN